MRTLLKVALLGGGFALGAAELLRRKRDRAEEDLGSVRGDPRRMPRQWWRRPAPRRDQVCYATKTDALNKFLDANWQIVENYGGPDFPSSPSEFDAVNHKYGTRARTIAEAVWAAMPLRHRSYCLDDIDVEALNDTSPAREFHVPFRLPDFVEERRLLKEQEAFYREQEGAVPF